MFMLSRWGMLTISISFMLAYRGYCFRLSIRHVRFSLGPIVTDARPQPRRPAESATPNTAPPFHLEDDSPSFGRDFPSVRAASGVGPGLVVVHLRAGGVTAAIDVAAAAPGMERTLFPGRAAWPRVLAQEGGSALQIELDNMQVGR